MPRHSTYRSRTAVDSVGGELSSGQLGVGIFVAIVFGLVCFILGYVVANVDQPLPMAEATVNKGAAPSAPAPAPEGTETPAPNAAREETVEPTPRPTTPATPVQGPSRQPSDPASRVGPGARTIEPLPAPGAPTPMTRTSVNIANLQENASTAPDKPAETPAAPAEDRPPIIPPGNATPEPAPQTESSASDLDTLASAKPAAPRTESAPANTPAPAPAAETPVAKPAAPKPEPKPPAGAPTVRRGSYGVQVAAFNGPRRQEQADESRKRLKEATGLDAEIVKSSDGAYEKVVVTGFSTRDEANVQCEKLKTKTGYASSWVIRLP